MCSDKIAICYHLKIKDGGECQYIIYSESSQLISIKLSTIVPTTPWLDQHSKPSEKMSTTEASEQALGKSPLDDDPRTTVQSTEVGHSIDPQAERSIVWKFDLRILPVLAVMYLFNSLDKSNLGNAKTAGLESTCTGPWMEPAFSD
jgi:hypothetical protein